MFKRIALLASMTSVFGLTGCVTAPSFKAELPDPRPSAQDSSYAMKVALAMKTTVECLGCEDTVLWNDEKHLADQVGFDVKGNTAKEFWDAEQYRLLVMRLHREGKLNKETLPPLPKLLRKQLLASSTRDSSSSLQDSLMLVDSVDGRWTNPNSHLSAGLALGLVTSMFETKDHNNRKYPPTSEMKALFVLPSEKQIKFNLFTEYPTPEENKFNNIGVYAGKEFVKLLTKSAVDMGYKPIGDIQVRYFKDNDPDWTFIWQPLENEAVGCPKVTAKTHRWDMCRVEWARYSISGERKRFTWNLEKDVVPSILGGNGKTERWMSEFGYNRKVPSGLIVDDAKKLTDTDGERNYRFAMGLQKYLKPGQFVYVPAYEIGKDKWSPQCVLDNKGVHYFTVVMPQNRPATSTPVVQEPEQSSGMAGWLNKAASAF